MPIWVGRVLLSHTMTGGFLLAVLIRICSTIYLFIWQTLLRARAMENYAYVCGVNRVGEDGLGLFYMGDSAIISPRGEYLATCNAEQEEVISYTLDKESMEAFRSKFPAWKDMDRFSLD